MSTAGTAPKITTSDLTRAVTVTIRTVLLTFFVFALDGLIELGTSPYIVSLFGIFGVIIASRLALTELLTRGFIIGLVALWCAYFIAYKTSGFIVSTGSLKTFLVFEHINLIALALSVGALSTWLFFRWRHFATLETFAICSGCIYLLAPHRDYHLDSPQFLNTFAWQLGVEPQSMLLICAGVIITALMLLLAFADSRERKLHIHEEPDQKRKNWILRLVALFTIFAVISALGRIIYGRYDVNKGLVTNGVGESSDEGTSPLGFHSALGSTNHPAALVRLEGDYSENPYSPMLYLREGALSEFNGHEMVIASRKFDTDINNTTPSQLYTGTADPALSSRTEVIHSVYLLADQKNAFAIDYPLAIKQLKNPDPGRFKSSYRAYSLAPTFKLDDLTYTKVGDPRWTKEVEEHYFKAHPDPRYRDLALRLTENLSSPVEKARAIVQYLSQKSIYTLTPRHEVNPDEDQVAPYLFGDFRGYCVHFAHATVYMLRALGLPARIATGYLTDLSQSKDGHILLRMSDRHAWAELYIEGAGWIPFDTQPEQVENAAETNVDLNLLEELMAKLNPGEEILPKDNLENEPNITEVKDLYLPNARDFGLVALLLLLSLLGYKVYLHYSWLLPASVRRKLFRSYRALVVALSEIGIVRHNGETLVEFRERLRSLLNQDPLMLVELINESKYGRLADNRDRDIRRLRDGFKHGRASLRIIPFWKRILGFINPLPLFGSRL